MEIIPSVSFKSNRPVVVASGDYQNYNENGEESDINGIMSALSDFDKIYYIDIDGIESNRLQTEIIRKISTRKEIWADVGARDVETVTDSFIAGANKTVISTKTMYSLDIMEKASEISDELVFSIDYKKGIISPSESIRKKDIEEIVMNALDLNFDHIVISDLSEDEFDIQLIEYLPAGDYNLYISGNTYELKENYYPEYLNGIILGLREAIDWAIKN